MFCIYMKFYFLFIFFWGTSLLEIGLHRLAPQYLNFPPLSHDGSSDQHTQMPKQMTVLERLSKVRGFIFFIYFFFFNQNTSM